MSFGGADIGSAHGSIDLDASGVRRGVADASRALSDFDRQSRDIGRGLDEFSRGATRFGVALTAPLAIAAKTFASFESIMAGVRAVTAATDAEFAALNETALRLGRDTTFSASDAGHAMEALAKAGVSTTEILAGAADQAVLLAGALGEDLTLAAESVANAMNLFGLEGENIAIVADTIARAVNSSTAELPDFNAGMRNIGPTLASFADDQEEAIDLFEEGAAAIAFFTGAGLKAADAGVSLDRAITNLVKPGSDEAAEKIRELGISAFDAQGNFVGLESIFDQVQRATADMTEEQQRAALTLIFGAEAVDVMTIAAERGGDAIRDQAQAMADQNSAAEQMRIRMDTVAGSFEQLVGSLEVLAIEFGEELAPAIRFTADTLAALADAFAGLGDGTQTFIAFSAAAVGGLALVAAAGAKVISIGVNTVRTWRTLGDAFRGTRQGCSTAAGCLETVGRNAENADRRARPLLGTLGQLARYAATGIAIGVAIDLSIDTIEAITEGGTPGMVGDAEALGTKIGRVFADAFGAAGLQGVEDFIDDNLDERELGNRVQNIALDVGFTLDTGFGTKSPADVIIKELDITVATAERLAKEAGTSVEVFLASLARSKGLIDDQRFAQILGTQTTQDATAATQEQTQAVDENTRAIDEQIPVVADLRTEQEKANDEFLAGQSLFLPFTRNAEDAEAATAEFNDTLAELVGGALAAARGVGDIAPELEGLQTGFGKVGDSVLTVTRKMFTAGQLDLSPSIAQALALAEHLQNVELSIAKLDQAIENNAADMAMWQGRINLVDQTIGTAEDGYAELNRLLQEGRLTQAEYNEILEAGIFIRERSIGGIEDERAEQAKLLPLLADYIRLHDAADGAIRDLTDEQRGFIAAMADSEVQTALQTVQLLAYLAAVGQIPAEKVTEFIFNASAANPVIAAVFEDLGLLPDEQTTTLRVNDEATPALEDARAATDALPDEHTTTLTAEDEATPAAADAREQVAEQVAEPAVVTLELDAGTFLADLDTIEGRVTAFVSLDGSVVTIGVDSEADALEFARRNADALDGRTVEVVVNADDGTYRTTVAEIRAQNQDLAAGVEVPIVADDQASAPIAEVDAATTDLIGTFDDLNGRVTVFQSFDGQTITIGVETEADALEFARQNAEALDGKTLEVVVTTEDSAYRTTIAQIEAERLTPKTVPVSVTLAGVGGGIEEVGPFGEVGAGLGGLQAVLDGLRPPPPVPITVDTSQAETETAEFKADLATVADAAVAEGEEVAGGLAAGIRAASGDVVAALDETRAGINAGFQGIVDASRAWGQASGANFSAAFGNALASGAGYIYQAAYTVAYNAYLGAKAALGIASPSKRGEELAANFGGTFTDVLGDQAADAERAARALAERTIAAMRGSLTTPALRSLVASDLPPVALAATLGQSGGGAGTVVNNITIPVRVEGVSDPSLAADLVVTRLARTWDRLDAGGALG